MRLIRCVHPTVFMVGRKTGVESLLGRPVCEAYSLCASNCVYGWEKDWS
ncbi:hypothetical protein [Bartonella sp. C271]